MVDGKFFEFLLKFWGPGGNRKLIFSTTSVIYLKMPELEWKLFTCISWQLTQKTHSPVATVIVWLLLRKENIRRISSSGYQMEMRMLTETVILLITFKILLPKHSVY